MIETTTRLGRYGGEHTSSHHATAFLLRRNGLLDWLVDLENERLRMRNRSTDGGKQCFKGLKVEVVSLVPRAGEMKT